LRTVSERARFPLAPESANYEDHTRQTKKEHSLTPLAIVASNGARALARCAVEAL
jgi:hypothetical protein